MIISHGHNDYHDDDDDDHDHAGLPLTTEATQTGY